MSGSEPEQSSVMQREEVLARAPYQAVPFTPMPVSSIFIRDSRDLRVGFTRQDDQDLEDMLGTDVANYNGLPVSSLRKYGQADIREIPRRSHAHHLKAAFTAFAPLRGLAWRSSSTSSTSTQKVVGGFTKSWPS